MRAPISFTVYGKPEPQGSKTPWLPRYKGGAFVLGKTGQPVIATMDSNKKLKPWRQEMTKTAIEAVNGPHAPENLPFPQGVAVIVHLHFYLERSASIPKRRLFPTVKPDFDKLCRAVSDSLKGTVYHDDGQVVKALIEKDYGAPARVEIWIGEVAADLPVLLAPEADKTLDLFANFAR